MDEVTNAPNNEAKLKVIEKYYALSQAFRKAEPEKAEDMEAAFMDILEAITKYDGCGIKFQVDREQGLHQNLAAANAFLQLNHYAQYLPAVFEEVVKGTAVALVGASSPIGLTIVGIDASYSVYKTYTKSNNVDQTIGRAGIEVGKPIMFAIMEDTISQAWKVPKYIFLLLNRELLS